MDHANRRSLRGAVCCVYGFMVLLAGLCLSAPWLFPKYIALRGEALEGRLPLLLISIYTAAIPAFVALGYMKRLLDNLSRNKVFERENVRCLSRLSWCCLSAAGVFLVSALYYVSFLALALMAAFIALLLRVLTAVFAQAVEIKEENDFTI